jgi:Gas vesicle synthesis protein GvpL/GvpF
MATPTETAVYVYGILPGDVALEEPTTGVGDPPMPVRLVRYRDIAALISDVDVSRPLGTPEDLLVHEALLDASAADAPVLPMRFGSVVANEDVVTSELLVPHYDEFAAALQHLEGYAEYIIRGRYVQDAILREILAEDPEAAGLTAQAQGEDQIAVQDRQLLLGEVIGERLSDKRAQDTRRLGEELAGQVSASVVRPPADEFEAVHTAFLIKADASDQLLDVVERLTADWDGRVELRVLGPVAAYDFVDATGPAAAG